MGKQQRLTTVVSTKGQVILPKAIRNRREWTAGTRLTVVETPEGVLLKAAPAFARSEIDSVFGVLQVAGRKLSLEEMDAAIAMEAKSRARD